MNGRGIRFGRAAFAAMLFAALVIAGWGFVSLLNDTEVVADPAAGPLAAPLALGIAALFVLAALASPSWASLLGRGAGRVVVTLVTLGAEAAAVYLAVLGITQFVANGRPMSLLIAVAAHAPTAYTLVVLGAGILSALGIVLASAGTRSPRWPWENEP